MRRPSIFSRNYERIMRRRKRKILVSIVIIFIITITSIGFVLIKYKDNGIYNNIIALLNRVNEKQYNKEEIGDKDLSGLDSADAKVDDIEEVDSSNEMINLSLHNRTITLEYKTIEGKKCINAVKGLTEKEEYSLKSGNEEVVIRDENQNIFLCKTDGSVVNLTLNEYVAPDGEVFLKNNVLEIYQGYIWHSQVKFLDDNKIVYVSNVPYFGYGLKQYLQTIDINTGIHTTLWNFVGENVVLRESEENGLEVEIDGNIKYIK